MTTTEERNQQVLAVLSSASEPIGPTEIAYRVRRDWAYNTAPSCPCCAGSASCGTPEAHTRNRRSPMAHTASPDALEVADKLDHLARYLVSDRSAVQQAAALIRAQHAALSALGQSSPAS